MKYKVLILTAITFVTTCFGVEAKNILSLKESITDNAIVYPSSFETNTKEMMENWYLKNYAIIDESNIENRDYGLVSDAEYIRRLKALPTDIEMPFNQIVKSYIERYVVRSRTLVAQMLGMCPYYMPIFEEALERHQMPLELKYIPIIESALNPNAVSPAGAGGLWQFMITTAKGVGLTVDTQLDERRDPYKSSEKAAVYFKQLYDTYHDWSLAIAAYNCGPGNVNKAIRRAGTDNPDFWEIYNYLPRETRGYVPAFIAANYVMNYYQKHNINPTLTKKPLIIDTVAVTKRIHLNQISDVLNIPLDEIKILNPQYRAGVINGSQARPLTLALPSQQIYSYIMAEDRIENYQKSVYAQRGEVKPGDVRQIVGEEEVADKYIYHTVTDGEDFIEIADRYGMEYDALKELNQLTSTTLHPGQVLQVINMNSVIEETVMGNTYANNGNQELVAENTNRGNSSYNNNSGYSSNYNDDYNSSYNNSYNNSNSGRNNNNSSNNNSSNRNNGNNYNNNNSSNNYNNNNGNHNNGNNVSGRDNRPVPPKPDQSKTQPKNVVPEKQNTAPKNNNNTAKNDNKNNKNNTPKNDNKNNNTAKNDNKGNTKNDNKNNTVAKNDKDKNKNNTAKNDKKKNEEKKPQPSPKHKVKEGDNLTKIANQHGVSPEDLRAANNINGDHIEIGQNLTIPEKGYAKKHPQPKQQTKEQPKNQGKQHGKQHTQTKDKDKQHTQAKDQGKSKNNATTNHKDNKGKDNNNTTNQKSNKGKNKDNNTTAQPNNKGKNNNSTTQQNKKGNNKAGKKK
jgi:membrane-bound lytic murein transglycosylase D